MFTRICKNTDLPIPIRITRHQFFEEYAVIAFFSNRCDQEPIYFEILIWNSPNAPSAAEKLCGYAVISLPWTFGVTVVFSVLVLDFSRVNLSDSFCWDAECRQ